MKTFKISLQMWYTVAIVLVMITTACVQAVSFVLVLILSNSCIYDSIT